MKKQNFITFLTKPVSRIELIVAGVFVSPLILASVVSAATTISTNIVTEGTLSVTGTTTLMGNVGIGTSTPESRLDVHSSSGNLLNLESSASFAQINVTSYRNSAITHSLLNGQGARGTKAFPLAIQSGDALLSMRAEGYGTSGFVNANDSSAGIDLAADENFTDETHKAGKIVFKTVGSTETFMSTRMTIKGSGNIGIGTTTPTTQLHVTTTASNSTSTMTIGKSGQNKGSCLVMYDVTGAVKYVSIVGTSFVISATSCQ